MTTRALIIGGGIAGPVTAMALRKAGIDSTVYEAYDRAADGVGAFLTLAVNGMAALHTLDLHKVVRGFDTPTMNLTMNGKRLVDLGFGDPLPDGTTNQTILRADMYGALRDEAVLRGVPVEYGKKLVSATRDGDGVTATFADGTTAHGDLLIGADGLRSVTRTIIDPAAPAPRYVPLLNVGGYARGLRLPGTPGEMNMVAGRECFYAYVINPNGEAWWFANPRQPKELSNAELAKITIAGWRTKLLTLFEKDDALPRDLVNATEDIFSGWNTYDFPKVPTWHRDHMIIIGDAAHATSPAAGQGASLALEDAVTLAKCLRDLPTVPAAFAAYEALRRTRVERVVAQGKRNGSGKSLGPVMRRMLPLFFKLYKPSPTSLSWLYDYRVDWTEPVRT